MSLYVSADNLPVTLLYPMNGAVNTAIQFDAI